LHQPIADPSAIDYSIRLAEWGAIPIAMSRDALIVGVNLYEDEQLANLKAPATDAEAVAQLLTDYGDFRVKRLPEIIKDGTLQVGRKTKVSLTQLEAALVQLFLPKGQHIPDTALFYFSGHGIRKEQGIAEGFLATSDAYPQLGFYGLSLPWLRRLLRESPVRQQIVWLDCCHSGELLNFAEADPGDRGKGRDRCFIAASREFEAAYEDISGRHSVLTGALLQGLDPKRQENRAVTNYDLIDFLNQALKSATQRPLFANSGGQILLTGTGAEAVNPVLAGICPYKGLTYFDCNEEDPKYFYGRTALTDQLLEKVRQGNFLAVLGASGSGKSSVVRAGLLHQLKLGQRLSGSEDWQLYIFRPGEHPLKRLAEVFVESGLSAIDRATQLAKAEELIGTGDVGLGHLITAVEASRVVLVVDQFEEVFTLCQDKTERQQFFECLLKAGEREDNKLCLVLTMRADFFGKCAEYGELASQIQQHLVTVTPMTPEELEQAITEPAKKVGLEVERELVTEMMADVQGSPGSLPLLQYTLTELWKQRTVERLTLSAYTRLGGVKGTLQKRANEVYESLSPEEQQTAKRIFLELTQLGEGTEDTRRQVKKRDLVSTEQSQALVDSVIQTLADAKLVVTSTLVEKGLSSEPVAVVDVAHEALIRHWGRLRQWLTENRNALRQKRSIEADAQEWLDKDKARDYLLQGLKLAEAEDFLQRGSENVSLSSLAQDYVEVSQKERDRIRQVEEERRQRELEQERKARKAAQMRNRVAAISVVGLTGLAVFAGFQWYSAQKSATKEKQQSLVARTQASEALFLANKPLDALVEAVQAGKLLRDTNQKPTSVVNQTTIALQQAVNGVRERNRLEGHKDEILDISFSPDGKTIASVDRDYTIKLWSRDGKEINEIKPRKENRRDVISISFSPNGKMIASASDDGLVRIWNLEGQELQTLEHEYIVTHVRFSPDGKTIASAAEDGIIRLWNLKGQELQTLKPEEPQIKSVGFSPDGKTIASASYYGTVKLWNQEGQEIKTFELKTDPNHSYRIASVSFSPDGNMIVAASRDGSIQLRTWEGEKLETLEEYDPVARDFIGQEILEVTSVSFSPDSKIIAAARRDGTIKLWSVEMKQLSRYRPDRPVTKVWRADVDEVQTFKEYNIYQSSLNFSPDSKMIASASSDGFIKLWNVENMAITTPIISLPSTMSLSPDGKTIAFASRAGSKGIFRLWNLADPEPKGVSYIEGDINSISFSPDGKMIASAGADGTVILWSRKSQTVLQILERHTAPVNSVSFSPDSKMIASAGDDGTVILWNLENQKIKTFDQDTGEVKSVSFSSNGKMIASASFSGIVTLWNLEGQALQLLKGHNYPVTSVEFSPDSKMIASASYDTTVKLWNLEGQEIETLRGHDERVSNVGFISPDGQLLASASDDGIVKLWNLEGQELKTIQWNDRGIFKTSFSSNGRMLTASSRVLMLWDFHLDNLLVQGCDWLRDYLKNPNNGMSQDDDRRTICDDVKDSPQLQVEQEADNDG
jgi:WD40 repeat protein/energy-coupling factor transporter ATP-binding protein EcfA2